MSRSPLDSLVSVNEIRGGVIADGDTAIDSAIRAAVVVSRPVSLRAMRASCARHLTPLLTSDCLLCQHLNRMTVADVVNLGEFEHMVLLAIMRLGDDAYAVPVRDEIARCTGRDVSRGSIYITLDRLETKGYLRSRLADPTPERGGRAKRYYALRPRAIAALRDSRRALVALWRGLDRVLGEA